MKPKKVLKISYFSGNNWGYAIWNAINDAGKRNKKYKLSKKFRDELGNIMLAISFRLDFLPIIISRLQKETLEICNLVKVRDKTKDEYAFDIKPEVKHSLLIDVDSFIFELRSCCELMEKLIKKISRHYKKFSTKKFSQELPKKNWSKSKWHKELHKLRIDIFHHTAPYIDVDITNEPRYDLLFCKENIHEYRKSKNYTRFGEISAIYRGFCVGSSSLSKYVITRINKLK